MKQLRLLSWALLALLTTAACSSDDSADNPASPDTPTPELPADCFTIDVETASTEGIKLTYTPKDAAMLYVDMLFDESYITEDGLTTDDICEQMLQIANRMIDKDSEGGGYGFSIDFCLEHEMLYRGTHSGTHYGGHTAGTRYYLSVVGLTYDEESNTFSAATQVTLSDPFEITEETLPVDKPWVEMTEPTYANGKITVIITRNEAAGDYLFGGTFAADYRDSHSDSDIISEMAGTTESMYKYLLDEWKDPIVLTGEVAPGEKKLFVATGEKDCITRDMQLNWMILQAPYEADGEVRIIDSASGIKQPEYPAPENPEPEPEPEPEPDMPFTTSVSVEGGIATLTITPSDPTAYYVLDFDVASEFATTESEAALLDWKFKYVENPLDNQYYDYAGTKQYDIAGYMASHNDLFQGTTTYTAEADPGSYYFYFFIIEFDHPNWTVNLSSPLYKVPFTIE